MLDATKQPPQPQEIDIQGMRTLLAHHMAENLRLQKRVSDMHDMQAQHSLAIEQLDSSRIISRVALMFVGIMQLVMIFSVLKR